MASRAARVLAVLVIVAGGVLAWLVLGQDDGAVPVTSAEASDSQVVSAAVKEEVRDLAAEAATRAYGYSWDTLADDKAAARALMTPPMQRRYDRTMAGVATSSQQDHAVVSADVVDTALVTATSSYARVLLFVNQSTTSDDLDEPLLDLDRVLVTLERVGGAWKVSELDAL